MKDVYWNDSFEDGDRKRRRQAEFLVHQVELPRLKKCQLPHIDHGSL